MKAVMERIEYNWWNFHIKLMDESQILREFLPKLKEIWEVREEVVPYLVLSVLGFPLGVVLGLLTVMIK
jgi:hypothetical protein